MSGEPETAVTVHRAGGVVTVTLNRPERRNALDTAMLEQLRQVLTEVPDRPEDRVLVLTGAGGHFCAGADLRSRSYPDLHPLERTRRINEVVLALHRLPQPTIALVRGVAVGAGMNLALGCDVRLAATSARFDTRFLQIGLHPGGGHTWMQRRIVGPQAAMATVVFGQVVDGPEAERIGLAYRCVPDDELLDAARRFAAGAAGAPRQLAIVAKQTIQDMADIASHTDAVARELEPQLWTVRQPWFAERIAALQAKIRRR